jgi:hypothetical protein
MIVGMGVNVNYFVAMTANWTQAAVSFDAWLADRLGLTGEVDAEDEDGDAPEGGDSSED